MYLIDNGKICIDRLIEKYSVKMLLLAIYVYKSFRKSDSLKINNIQKKFNFGFNKTKNILDILSDLQFLSFDKSYHNIKSLFND